MSSTAISAQGSKLEIGTGTGSAKTISAIALGNPTILTCTAHGLLNGNVVALAGLTGANAAALNGLSLPIRAVTANTFAVDINTTGLTITAAGTATPVTYTAIGNLKTYTGIDGEASELDKTNLASVAKEFALGLVDFGKVSIEFDQDNTDAGQAALLAAQLAGTSQTFRLTFPDTHTAAFTGYVKKVPHSGGVDQLLKRSADIRISGAVTYA